MPKVSKDYNIINRITPEEHLKHCENMAEFFKKSCPRTAGQYISKAKKLRKKIAEGIV